jgi:hypothetical protein
MSMLHLLAGLMPKTKLALTQKGYGRVYSASTANISMVYTNVEGGVAPVAGDLVIWIALAVDSSSSPIVDVTGAGWVQSTRAPFTGVSPGFWFGTMAAKVIAAGDISSPSNIITGPTLGGMAFWAAYSVEGLVASVTIPNQLTAVRGDTSAPADQTQDSSAIAPTEISITLAVGGGSDNSPTVVLTGAATDISFTTANGVFISAGSEGKFVANKSVGGANITVSKSNDGTNNPLMSGYVVVA